MPLSLHLRQALSLITISLLFCLISSCTSTQPQTELTTRSSAQTTVAYKLRDDGRYQLIDDVIYDTQTFGKITLTKGFTSDGSTSPIKDTHETRLAGMLHDALYTYSSHLKITKVSKIPYTKEDADQVYCQQMKKLEAGLLHRQANCSGVSLSPFVHAAWNKYQEKRESRWAKDIK